jgi:hypothetical protein
MSKSYKFPLIIEPYPENYNGYEFITLIKFNDENYLNIVDNVINKKIICYVLDYCKSEQVNESEIIEIASDWHTNNRENYPISIELSRRGITSFNKIVRKFPIEYVTRTIGPVFQFPMSGNIKIKRRKRKIPAKNIEIVNKTKYSL